MASVQAVIAVFALIVIGYVMRRNAFPSATLWPDVERLCYFVLFPSLLIVSVANAPLSNGSSDVWLLVVAVAAAQLITAVLAFPVIFLSGIKGADFTSFMQGAVRFNNYAVFGVVTAIAGRGGEQLVAPVLPFIIIIANILSVTILSLYGDHKAAMPIHPAKRVLDSLYKNPLVIACCIGLMINYSGITLPQVVEMPLLRLGQAGVALALMAVGAALKVRGHQKSALGYVLLASFYSLIVWPVLYLWFANLLSLNGDLFLAGLIISIAPTATSAYLLSRQLGGNAELMAAIITGQTLISLATMSFWLLWLGQG